MLEQKFYTVADVAEITGLTGRTIRNYLKDGTLHGRKIGVQWRFTEEDVENLFSETGGLRSVAVLQEEMISDFIKEVKEQEKRSCLVMDIPVEEGQAEEYLGIIENLLSEKEVQGVLDYRKSNRAIRLVLRGMTEYILEIMTKIEKDLN